MYIFQNPRANKLTIIYSGHIVSVTVILGHARYRYMADTGDKYHEIGCPMEPNSLKSLFRC